MIDLSPNTVQFGSWSFQKIRIEDMGLYSDYIKKTEYPVNLWSSSFAYIWSISQSNKKTIYWKIIDDMLVTFVHSKKDSLYLLCLPFGSGSPEKVSRVLFTCLNYCKEWNKQEDDKTLVKMINDSQLEFLKQDPEFDNQFRLVTLVGIERHFDVKILVALSGKDFSNLRNRTGKFRRDYPDAVISEYTEQDYDRLIELSEHWSSTSGQKYTKIFDKVYYREIVKHCFELGQIILTIKTGGKIIGMVSGSELPTGQAWASVVKFESGIAGLSETLMIEFAKELNRRNPSIEQLNVGSDLGDGGLRVYKLKFKPVLNLKRYQVYLKK